MPKYGRVFVGKLKNWQDKSIANIIVHPKSEVEGYAVRLTPNEIIALDKCIGCPDFYKREKVELKRLPYKDGDPLIQGEVYILTEKTLISQYKRPSGEQLEAICRTLSTSLYLRIGAYEDKKHPLSLNVFNGAEMVKDMVHETKASMKFLNV